MTLGSLFDGSGGFPLGALINGITPLWASEIEPFPIRVTTNRLPGMRHYGDVSKLNGAELPSVDIISFGSPCQDMSVAGRRAGLDGERSGLFHQAIRIVKEMRCATNGKYPRFIVWENVPGAFSSNGGDDFRCVLEEISKVKSEAVSVTGHKKWSNAGSIVGDDFSLCWRVLDAQYWGVPQRRRRIYLVADFNGERAGEVLFERTSLCRDTAPGRAAWKGIAGEIKGGAGETGGRLCLNDQGGSVMSVSYGATATLRSEMHGWAPMVIDFAKVYDARGNGDGVTASTVTGDHNGSVSDYTALEMEPQVYRAGAFGEFVAGEVGTLKASGGDCVCGSESIVCDYRVRRLTPPECARLQGFPDWWCEDLDTPEPPEQDMAFWRDVFGTYAAVMGKKPRSDNQIRKWLQHPHTDSAEYKMWGNGVALPCVSFVMAGLADQLAKAENDEGRSYHG